MGSQPIKAVNHESTAFKSHVDDVSTPDNPVFAEKRDGKCSRGPVCFSLSSILT
jgi:hypothetical protein